MNPCNSEFRAYALVRQIDECVSTKLRVTGNHACYILVILNCIYIHVYILFSNSDVMESRYKMVKLFADNLI